MLNTTKVKSEDTIQSVCCVRNEFTRLWSPIRCMRSPISLVSKNDMGSFKSLMKKSLTNEMLMRSEICSSSQRRTKSMAVRLLTDEGKIYYDGNCKESYCKMLGKDVVILSYIFYLIVFLITCNFLNCRMLTFLESPFYAESNIWKCGGIIISSLK